MNPPRSPSAARTHTPAFLRYIDPAVLRELASLLDSQPGRIRKFRDPELAAAELAEILERGGTPTVGWWRRHLATYNPPARPNTSEPTVDSPNLEGAP